MSVSSLASFDYLEKLPGTSFARLYEQPSTSLAIFRRMLPPLGIFFESMAVMALIPSSKDFCHGFTIHEQAVSSYRYGSLGPSQ